MRRGTGSWRGSGRTGRRRTTAAVIVAAVLSMTAFASVAVAAFVLGDNAPVAGNPVERVSSRPLEPLRGYRAEVPRRCTKDSPRGVSQFALWLRKNARRGTVGSRSRCENLGGGNGFSFHSEGRALDYSLDAGNPADAAEAERLIKALLARDSKGRGAALARRMGIMEIIWDCSYWAQSQVDEESGFTIMQRYFLCPSSDPSTAHRNHIHFSFTRQGAAGASSFWWSLAKWAPANAPFKNCPPIREPHPGSYSGYGRNTVSPKSASCATASKVLHLLVRAEERLASKDRFLPPEGVTVKGYRCWDLDPENEIAFAGGDGMRMRICGNATQTFGYRR